MRSLSGISSLCRGQSARLGFLPRTGARLLSTGVGSSEPVPTQHEGQHQDAPDLPSQQIPPTQHVQDLPIRKIMSTHEKQHKHVLDLPIRKTAQALDGEGQIHVTMSEHFVTFEPSWTRLFTRSYFYLRDLCQCPICKDPHSKQRNFRTTHIPKDIKPKDFQIDGINLHITWSDDHVSQWDLNYLINPHPKTKAPVPSTWGGKRMARQQHWVSFDEYIGDDLKFARAMHSLQYLGLIFVKDIPDSREMVEKIATRMGPLRYTFYGKTWDVRTVPEAANVAYTNQFLGFHMDLMYMDMPPGYQLLHCLENSCDGGESLFSDTFHAVELLQQRSPSDHKKLADLKLSYEYNHDSAQYFQHRPVLEKSKLSSDQFEFVNYSPPFQGPLPQLTDPKSLKSLKMFENILESEASIFELKLKPGECVIFNNRRVAHARRQFNTATGSRWLAGAYVDTDALRSCFAVNKAKYPDSLGRHAGDEGKEVPN